MCHFFYLQNRIGRVPLDHSAEGFRLKIIDIAEKIGKSLPLGGVVALYGKSGFFALGEVREFEGGLAIKPIKQFDI